MIVTMRSIEKKDVFMGRGKEGSYRGTLRQGDGKYVREMRGEEMRPWLQMPRQRH